MDNKKFWVKIDYFNSHSFQIIPNTDALEVWRNDPSAAGKVLPEEFYTSISIRELEDILTNEERDLLTSKVRKYHEELAAFLTMVEANNDLCDFLIEKINRGRNKKP